MADRRVEANPGGFFLSSDELDTMCPAWVRLSHDGRVEDVGPAIRRHTGAQMLDKNFFDAFALDAPQGLTDFETLAKSKSVLFLRTRTTPEIQLRGIAASREQGVFLLVGVVADIASDGPKLSYNDLSPVNNLLDLTLAAEVHMKLLDEAEELARELAREKKVAETASAAKSVFLATMSHEIRTPLNGVLGMASLLSRTSLDERQRGWLDVIVKSGESLMGILNSVLDLSKIEAGKYEFERAPFNAVDIIEDVVCLFERKAHDKGLAFACTSPERRLCSVYGDASRLKQVVTNLACNAVKFTDRGEVRISLAAEAQDDGDTRLVIEVADTGIGIDEDALGRVFTPFTQADASLARKYGGVGLGLAVARRIVELMGGTISVDSAPGAGSKFRVEIALERAPYCEYAAEKTERAPKQGAAAALRAGRPLRILAAEDNEVNRRVLAAYLEPAGADLVIACDGAEAIEAFNNGSFDLVLMDVQMPGVDGVEATRAIRAAERKSGAKRTPIVALTANAMTHQIEECFDAGMDAHLAKPLTPAKLLAIVAEKTAIRHVA